MASSYDQQAIAVLCTTIEDAEELLHKVKPEEAKKVLAAADSADEGAEDTNDADPEDGGEGGEGGTAPSGAVDREGSGAAVVLDDKYFANCQSLPSTSFCLPACLPDGAVAVADAVAVAGAVAVAAAVAVAVAVAVALSVLYSLGVSLILFTSFVCILHLRLLLSSVTIGFAWFG